MRRRPGSVSLLGGRIARPTSNVAAARGLNAAAMTAPPRALHTSATTSMAASADDGDASEETNPFVEVKVGALSNPGVDTGIGKESIPLPSPCRSAPSITTS